MEAIRAAIGARKFQRRWKRLINIESVSRDTRFVEELENVGTGSERSIDAKRKVEGVRRTNGSPSLVEEVRGSDAAI